MPLGSKLIPPRASQFYIDLYKENFIDIMDTYRFCLLTVVSLTLTMIVVVNTAWFTRDTKLFGEELRQKNNITTLHSLISSNKTASQLHLEKHVTKKTTGKSFGFMSVTSCTKNKDSIAVSCYPNDCSQTVHIY